MINKDVIIIILFGIQNLLGQFSVSNLFDYQLGNLPGTDPANLTTHFDQLSLSYRYDDFILNGRFEHFQTKDHSASYNKLAQRSFVFNKNGFDITVGNFYQIFGRGLLLRTYEIPGVIREQTGLRTRYGFYRDIDGVRAGFENSWIKLQALRGRPLREDLPPTFSDDILRQNLLEGAQGSFYISEWILTAAYLRNNSENALQEYTSIAMSTNLPFNIQFYSEYVKQLSGNGSFFDISDHSAHALYMSMNFVIGRLGLSAEFKDYQDFLLGFNDPPPLVKEHEYLLLNRSTHSLEPMNESGWQTEFFYTFGNGHTFVANLTEAVNETTIRRYIFKEKFLEIGYHPTPDMIIKGFADLSREDIRLEKDRYTYGIYIENEWPNQWGATLDLEYQDYIRTFNEPLKVKNYAILVSLSYAPDLTCGITWEHTTDSGEIREDWLGYDLSYQYSQYHLINLFYGKRRGGNACTGGICYQVLPFDGIEFRLTTNL
jgi:hypothetical protein